MPCLHPRSLIWFTGYHALVKMSLMTIELQQTLMILYFSSPGLDTCCFSPMAQTFRLSPLSN